MVCCLRPRSLSEPCGVLVRASDGSHVVCCLGPGH